ncbi:MAG: plastocyanin/azurin family copper-binding protein [Solirubrobacterales bacterium]
MHRRLLFPVAALLGVAVAVLPAVASSEAPGISAYNEPGLYGSHSWMPSTATVSAGGVVKFSNPYSTTYHGLKFTGGSAGATPGCTGIPAAASEEAGATNWHGECTFSAPGTYTFICTVHPGEMKGTITVTAAGTPVPGPTPTPTPPPTTPVAPSPESPSSSPFVGSPSLRSSQHGSSVHGSVEVSKAGVGGRLEVDLLAKSASLAKAKRSTQVRVGRLVRSSLYAGSVSFAVTLDAKARRALKRHHRLALTVKIVLTPVTGAPVTVNRSVVEHA